MPPHAPPGALIRPDLNDRDLGVEPPPLRVYKVLQKNLPTIRLPLTNNHV